MVPQHSDGRASYSLCALLHVPGGHSSFLARLAFTFGTGSAAASPAASATLSPTMEGSSSPPRDALSSALPTAGSGVAVAGTDFAFEGLPRFALGFTDAEMPSALDLAASADAGVVSGCEDSDPGRRVLPLAAREVLTGPLAAAVLIPAALGAPCFARGPAVACFLFALQRRGKRRGFELYLSKILQIHVEYQMSA